MFAFKTLSTVTLVHREGSLPDAAREYARDTITLGWEDRVKTRGRRRSDGGLEFGTTLPRSTVLREGDCLLIEPARTLVVVVERAEPVFVVRPASPREWGLFGYHIGNSHQPAMMDQESIVCPDVSGMLDLLTYHRIPFERALRPFTPLTGGIDHRHLQSQGD